jgi:hypothetical protein
MISEFGPGGLWEELTESNGIGEVYGPATVSRNAASPQVRHEFRD